GHLDAVRFLLDSGADMEMSDFCGFTPRDLAFQRVNTSCPPGSHALLAHGADLNIANAAGRSPLHNAAAQGSPELVGTMLSHGADVHQRSFEGKTPLQVVGAYDVLEDDAVMVVDQLLDAGANVNAKYSYGHTPISLYCFDSHVEIARVLLERGADVLVPDGQGWLPLYWTIYDGSALVLEL
ncbi:ankyrin repeat-containing domain protein, partial [Diaporthe sp. PMI_573]